MNDEPLTHQGDLSLVDSVVQLSYLIQGIIGRCAANHNLSIIQIRLLGILRDREPSMLQLAKHLNLDKSSITGLVDRAERRGLVERVISPNDRRGFNVRLTSEGRRLVAVGAGEIEREIHAAMETLAENERLHLTALASKILIAQG